MKPPKFHRGQAVTPNKHKDWIRENGWETVPKFGEIYHVRDSKYVQEFTSWVYQLEELDHKTGVLERCLDPVDLDTADLQELIATSEPMAV